MGKSPEKWKKKYYEQLDYLDQREKEWEDQETVWKRAIGHLCIAAEGHDSQLDDSIKSIRQAIRNNDNVDAIDKYLNQMSDRLIRLEEDSPPSNRKLMGALKHLFSDLELPNRLGARRKQLLNRLDKATDDQDERVLEQARDFLQSLIDTQMPARESQSWFKRLINFQVADKKDTTSDRAQVIAELHTSIDWPETLKSDVINFKSRLQNKDADNESQLMTDFAELINRLRYSTYSAQHTESETEIQRRLLLSFIYLLEKNNFDSEILHELQSRINSAGQQEELDELSNKLAHELTVSRQSEGVITNSPPPQELLLQLLEQLIIPSEMDEHAQEIKLRLEGDPGENDWQVLLKDIANLLNAIRSHVQREKEDFEDFLHQVTDRLQELDSFLQVQTSSLKQAEESGRRFDRDLNNQVHDIRSDMNTACDLNELKMAVEKRLDSMMLHIRDHRIAEEARLLQAQKSLEKVHFRMDRLEQESTQLKAIIKEKDRQAQTDTLTRIPNRLAFEQRLSEEIARQQRFGIQLSLAMLDIDHFKRINDEYGHQAGDKALRTIAQLLSQRIRQTDFIARYGGEEFVMLIPGNNEQQAFMVVNEMREKIEASGFHYHGLPVTITMSAGISEFQSEDTAMDVLNRADRALYTAKYNGRNQCVLASSLSS